MENAKALEKRYRLPNISRKIMIISQLIGCQSVLSLGEKWTGSVLESFFANEPPASLFQMDGHRAIDESVEIQQFLP